MFEKYLGMEGFEKIGGGEEYGFKVTISPSGNIGLRKLINLLPSLIRKMELYFNKEEKVIGIEFTQAEDAKDALSWGGIVRTIGGCVRSKVGELHSVSLNKGEGVRMVFPGRIFKDKGMAFIDVRTPFFERCPTGQRKGANNE